MNACTHAVNVSERERYILQHRVRAVVFIISLVGVWRCLEPDNRQLPHFFYAFINDFGWWVVNVVRLNSFTN